ncbi:hypothetical protein PR001_g4904 [Phytophthora rubi]|uniref:Uncharacterized protein n=1 Tax=Phytophthora rubi TaxID=129364 RepID=A0A6A3NXG3_9STRA|nr:hypothetical protein PR001_g4904 [Phytophthora rubi]KAE9046181.1 hypothetical protein PR002_g1804 [Phytophthora rubi]
MATSRSIALMGLFVVVSTGQSLLEFRAMRADSRVLLQLVDQRRASQRHLRNNKLVNVSESINLLAIVIDSTHDSASFQPNSLESVRLWACLPYPLTSGMLERLQALEKLGVYSRKNEDLQVTTLRRLSRRQNYVIAPSEMVLTKVKPVYKSVLEHLPNVVYYPGGAGSWDTTSVVNVSLFAVLEVGLFLSFNAFVQRRFALSPLHQLAFVLETEFYPVQAILFVLILNVLQFELKHFGTCSCTRPPR